ncbi:MAG: ATP-binding protein [Phycisphaerae bacterium]
MATLYVLQGPDKGRTFKTSDDNVIVGRASDQAPLNDPSVSRRHAQLSFKNGVGTLIDMNSANGTYLNGLRVTAPMRLKHGDQVRVGSTLLVYWGDESVEQISGVHIPHDLVTLDAGGPMGGADIAATVPSNEDSVIIAAPDTQYAVKSWKAMRALTEVIGSLPAPEQMLPRVLDILFEEVDVDRGVIFLQDPHTKEFIPEVVRFHSRKARADAQRDSIVASRTIINHVVESREGVLCSNAVEDERFRAGKSVHALNLRSVICAPIVARDKVLGVIHIDCPIQRRTYNEHHLRLVTAIAYQTGLALENARLVQAQVERERLAAVGETIAYLSHSIKNILQSLRAGSDLVQRGLDRRDFAVTTQGWKILDRNLDKCYALMLNMLAFSKQREPAFEQVQVNAVIEDVVQLAQSQADDAKVVLLSELDEKLPPIAGDFDGLHQVILNLVSNAIDAVPHGSGLVNVRTQFDIAERRAQITVTDNGSGVPDELRERIFQPFFSTKGHGGTGLGLAVARKIVSELGGTLELTKPREGGSVFIMRLPLTPPTPSSPNDTQGPR